MLSLIQEENWRWVVLLASTSQSMVLIGVWSCSSIYMEAMKEVSAVQLLYTNRIFWPMQFLRLGTATKMLLLEAKVEDMG